MPPLTLKDQLLTKPKGEANIELLNPDFQTTETDIITSLKKYRQFALNLPTAYKNYMQEITNGNQDPEKFALEQIDKAQEVIDTAKDGFNISRVKQAHQMLELGMNINNMQNLSQGSLFCEDLFRLNVQGIADRVKIFGDLDKTDLDKETLDIVNGALKAYTPTPSELGISEKTMNQINGFADCISTISTMFSRMRGNDLENRLEDVYSIGEDINRKMLNYLKTGDEQFLPKEEDFYTLLTTMTEHISNRPLYQEGTEELDYLRGNLVDLAAALGDMWPSLKQPTVMIVKDQKIKEANDVFKLIDDVERKPIDNEQGLAEFRLSYGRLDTLARKGIASQQEMERLRMIRMARDPEFRESEKQRALDAINDFINNSNYNKTAPSDMQRNGSANGYKFQISVPGTDDMRPDQDVYAEAYKIYLQAIFVEKEAEKAKLYNNTKDMGGKLKIGTTPAMAELFSGKPLSKESIIYLDNVLDNFNSNEAIKSYCQMSPENFKSQIDNSPIVIETLAESAVQKSDANIKINFNDVALSTFTQGGRNSKEYNDIAKAIGEVNAGVYKKEGNVKDVENLYNSLKTYVNTHDSRPFRDYGKERFNQAAILMGQIGDKLADKNPQMAEQINKDINILMLRNKPFRDAYIKSQQDRLARYTEGKKLTPELYKSFAPHIQKDIKSLTEKISFGTLVGNALDKKTKYGQVTGKLTPENQEKLLNQYSGFVKYAHGLDPDKLSFKSEIDNIKNTLADDTKPDITNELKVNVAKMILRNQYIEGTKKAPITFEDAKKINDINDAMEDPEQLNQFIQGEDFQIFFDSLGRDGLDALVNDPKVIGTILSGYDSITQLSPQEKQCVKLMNFEKVNDAYTERFSMFFNNLPEEDKKILVSTDKKEGLAYSVGRTALESLTLATMLADDEFNFNLDDILNPYKLRAERDKYSKQIMDKFKGDNDKFITFAQEKYEKGMKRILEYFDEKFADVDEISLDAITQDKFKNAFTASIILNDMGQELERYDKTNPIIGYQSGVASMVKTIFSQNFGQAKTALGFSKNNAAGKVDVIWNNVITNRFLVDEYKKNKLNGNTKFSDTYALGNKTLQKMNGLKAGLADEKYTKPLNLKFGAQPDSAQIFALKGLNGTLIKTEDIKLQENIGFTMLEGIDHFKEMLDSITPPEQNNLKQTQHYLEQRAGIENRIAFAKNNRGLKALEQKAQLDMSNAIKSKDRGQFIKAISETLYHQQVKETMGNVEVAAGMLSYSKITENIDKISKVITNNTKGFSFEQISQQVKAGKMEELTQPPKAKNQEELDVKQLNDYLVH